MSAWIVEKGLIDCLVQSLAVEGIIAWEEADKIGQAFWHENHLSIEARYGDEPNTPEYHFTGVEAPLDDAIVWKQLNCYEYQTCEISDWHDSDRPVYLYWRELERVYQARYNCDHSSDLLKQQKRHAPWGITRIEEAIKR